MQGWPTLTVSRWARGVGNSGQLEGEPATELFRRSAHTLSKAQGVPPALKQHIADPKSPEYAVLRMTPKRIRLMASHDLQYTDVESE